MAGRKPRAATTDPDVTDSVVDGQPRGPAPEAVAIPSGAPVAASDVQVDDSLSLLTAERDAALALVNQLRAQMGRISAARDKYRAVANQCIAELDYWQKTTGNDYPKRRRAEISKELAEIKDE